MAKDKEQPVTAGEARMGTVGEQRAIICPKGKIQDWHRQWWRFKKTTWLCGSDSVPKERDWLDKETERGPNVQLIRFVSFSTLQWSYRQPFTVLWSLSSISAPCSDGPLASCLEVWHADQFNSIQFHLYIITKVISWYIQSRSRPYSHNVIYRDPTITQLLWDKYWSSLWRRLWWRSWVWCLKSFVEAVYSEFVKPWLWLWVWL